jgi:pimeloyl-ACP methyl ester carboxylesterase
MASGALGVERDALAVVARLFRGSAGPSPWNRPSASSSRVDAAVSVGKHAVLDVWTQLDCASAMYEGEGWIRLGEVAFEFASRCSADCLHEDNSLRSFVDTTAASASSSSRPPSTSPASAVWSPSQPSAAISSAGSPNRRPSYAPRGTTAASVPGRAPSGRQAPGPSPARSSPCARPRATSSLGNSSARTAHSPNTLPVIHASIGATRAAPWALARPLRIAPARRRPRTATRPRLGRRGRRGRPGSARAIRLIFNASLTRLSDLYGPIQDGLGRIDAPTLVGWGQHHPFFVAEQGRCIAGAIPGTGFRLYHGAGHFLPEERPAEVASDVTQLLSAVAARL